MGINITLVIILFILIFVLEYCAILLGLTRVNSLCKLVPN